LQLLWDALADTELLSGKTAVVREMIEEICCICVCIIVICQPLQRLKFTGEYWCVPLLQSWNTADGSVIDFTQYFFVQSFHWRYKFFIFLNFYVWLGQTGSCVLMVTSFCLTLLLFVCAFIKIMKSGLWCAYEFCCTPVMCSFRLILHFVECPVSVCPV
jgi:hypothetical protein